MKIVIDISTDDFEKVKCGRGAVSMMRRAIIHGAPLPKGHGRIIDESQITQVSYHEYISKVTGWQIPHCFIDGTDAPTIIEADTESEGEHGKV